MTPVRQRTANTKIEALAFVLAVLLDLGFAEPPGRVHPVVWLGTGIDLLEKRTPRRGPRSRTAFGAASALSLLLLAALAAWVAQRANRRLPTWLQPVGLALLLKPAFSVRMLLTAGATVRRSLEENDLQSARTGLRSLISRETSHLTASECSAAAIESLAENTTDGFAGPWLAFALFGLPGAWLFRTANTLDSRWGYHGAYEELGRFAARLDDRLAWLPARVSATLLVVAAPLGGGSMRDAWHCMRADHARTESPNAGWTMSAMAGALGRCLQKPASYTLNNRAPACEPRDIRRAERVIAAVACLSVLATLAILRMREGTTT